MGQKEPSPNVGGVGASIGSSFGGSIGIGGGFSFSGYGVSGKVEEQLVIGCRTCFAPSGTTFYNPETLLLQNIGNIQIAQPDFTVEGGYTQAGKDRVRGRCEAMPGHTYREIGIPGRPRPSPVCVPPITQNVCAVAFSSGVAAAAKYAERLCIGGLGRAICAGTTTYLAAQCGNFQPSNDFR